MSSSNELLAGRSDTQVCDACRNIKFPFGQTMSSPYKHSATYRDLCASAQNCDLCRLIHHGIQTGYVGHCKVSQGNRNSIDDDIAEALSRDSSVVLEWHSRSIHIKLSGDHISTLECKLHPHRQVRCYHIYDPAPSWALTQKHAIRTTTSYAKWSPALEYAKSFLQRTEQFQIKVNVLPTRVLDLGDSTAYQEGIRLVEPPYGTVDHYVALSHRWSTTENITTTRANRKKHMCCILLTQLPATFRDAVYVCRFLQVRYLWIDSLCVVQDDPADWRMQSKLMGYVYHGSACTLAAHCAGTDSNGFLHSALSPAETVEVSHSSDASVEISLSRKFHDDVVLDSPLNKRGWVLQERLLSVHTLHFVPNRIYLEATKDFTSFAYSHEIGFAVHRKTESLDPTVTPTCFSTKWLSTMELYTECDLTFEQDKFPAIAGIVSNMQRFSNRTHVCGLWANYIRDGLLWARRSMATLRQPRTPRAPSWSWASSDGAITFLFTESLLMGPTISQMEFGFDEPKLDQLKCLNCIQSKNQRTPNHERCFPSQSQLQIDGCIALTLCARVHPLQEIIEPSNARSSTNPTASGTVYNSLIHQNKTKYQDQFRLDSEEIVVSYTIKRTSSGSPLGWVIPDQHWSKGTPHDLHFLLIGKFKSNDTECLVGLIVVPAETCDNAYRRVGLGAIHDSKTYQIKFGWSPFGSSSYQPEHDEPDSLQWSVLQEQRRNVILI